MVCEKCNHEMQIGEYPFCPHDHQANSVIGDDIPGGLMIEHGICHPDGSPKRYDTKSSIYKAAKEKGLHVGAFVHGSPPGRTWV
jgi:hypothetical protein